MSFYLFQVKRCVDDLVATNNELVVTEVKKLNLRGVPFIQSLPLAHAHSSIVLIESTGASNDTQFLWNELPFQNNLVR